jgi:hypothetical protein
VATNEGSALALGFTQCTPDGKLGTISTDHYWEGQAQSWVSSVFLCGAGGVTGPLGSHHWQGTDLGFDPAGSLVSSRPKGGLAKNMCLATRCIRSCVDSPTCRSLCW